MTEIDPKTISRRSVRGIFALTIAQFINTLLAFILTFVVDPRMFGVYVVVSASLSFLAYFSDIGLGAALIQKKDKVTREDLVTTFTIQQALVLTGIAVALLFSSQVGQFYNLDTPGTRLFQALILSFFLSSLKTIPSITLERHLNFQKLIIPQIAEAIVFNVIAVVLAMNGFGITSFTFAVVARGIVGTFLLYLIAPWKIGIGISMSSAKKLLSFGVPFQANSFLALLKDDLLFIVLGKILPLTEVGFLGFAQKWAFSPLRLVMDKVIRVTFPAFSRLQNDKNAVTLALEKTISTISILIFPAIMGLVVIFPYFLEIMPNYNKWEPALPALIFFAVNVLLSSISTPLTNVLNALGKINITLRLMVFWTISTWILTFLLIKFLGFVGVAVASAAISLSVVLVIYIVKKHVKFKVLQPIGKPLISAALMAVALYFAAPLFATSIPTLILTILGGGLIYFSILFLIAKKEMASDIKTLLGHLKR